LPRKIKLKWAYTQPATEDGVRILVNRLWPRGLKKETAAIDQWLKEIALRAGTHLWTPRQCKRFFQKIGTLSDAAICPASDAAMELRARMGVRGPEPNHKCVLGHDEYIWFFRPRLADCCAIPSFDRLHL
jgi:hypothetical protein